MANKNRVYTAYGNLHAEMIKQFLRSFEIDAEISQESVGSTLGLTVGPLGKVAVLVPESQVEKAREILIDMEKGVYESGHENPDVPDDEMG